ncbi:uncharacterized protein LOC123498193 [Portunus trituberculatus]|uniref:uncharacterized protein LOC123498193 n=1 Tax=Portunus trituberculatus TaxID=210409 RepID=UPI001E1CD2AC|nr:uncharacterized protein LOC123498193 [Portunus trituberculatus]
MPLHDPGRQAVHCTPEDVALSSAAIVRGKPVKHHITHHIETSANILKLKSAVLLLNASSSPKLSDSTIFSRIHSVKAFHQITGQPEDILKTANITLFGLFVYTRMPFGLKNAAQTFQCFINEVVMGLPFCFALYQRPPLCKP